MINYSKKRPLFFCSFWPGFFDQKPATEPTAFLQNLQFWPQESQLLGRGVGGVISSKLGNWLANIHSGAYTSMAHPLFGAKDVCYVEKRWPNKKNLEARQL